MQETQIKGSDQRKPLLSCLGLIEMFLLMSRSVTEILEQTPLVLTSYDGGSSSYNCWLKAKDVPQVT